MAITKRSIATSIINELNQPFNNELYERVKDRVVALRAKYLRQSIGKYGIDELLQQTYKIELEKKTDIYGCIYYQTICKIPLTVRAIGSASPFKYVGSVTSQPYTFLRIYEVDTIPKIPINIRNKYYSIENGFIRVYNVFPKKIKIIDIFEDFEELINMCTKAKCVDDDTALPMPADFVDLIIKDLVSEFSQIQQNNVTTVED